MPYKNTLLELQKVMGDRAFSYFVLLMGPQLTLKQLDAAATTWEAITHEQKS